MSSKYGEAITGIDKGSSVEVCQREDVETKPEDEFQDTKKSFRSWLLLCYSTGPVASMSRSYVNAAIQSAAFAVGKSAAGRKCARRGNDCYVKFGAGTVHATSYVLYARAIYTSMEGVVAMLLMGIADYSNYRKIFLIASIVAYGCFALPFAALTAKTYGAMIAMTVLYGFMNVIDSIYQILEASYIPIFMRAASPKGRDPEEVRKNIILKRGSEVSVLGLVMSNIGGITALLIGVIISYSRGGPAENGYHNFLLAITIAGCITVVFSVICAFTIPGAKRKPVPKGKFLLFLTAKRMYRLLMDIRKYPNAFVYCVAWVIWNVTYSNFLNVFVLLFRSTLGLGNSDSEYTVYTFMQNIISVIGSLGWMYLYPRTNTKIKSWGYGFFAVQLFSNFWGCLGINSHSKVGFKHRWEFWLFEVFMSSSGSALRSLNRTVYSTLLPEGDEAQYFGLEIFLGVATGWIGALVNAAIQDRTNNDRFPFVPNTILVAIAMALYWYCDTEKGMQDAEKLLSNTNANHNHQSTGEVEEEASIHSTSKI